MTAAPEMREYLCPYTTRQGRPCIIPTAVPGTPCHMHDPDGAYARQHPAYRARLIERGPAAAPAAPRTRAEIVCAICAEPVAAGDPVRAVSMPAGPPAVGHPVCMSVIAETRRNGRAMPQRG
jgi:hypothetical protein